MRFRCHHRVGVLSLSQYIFAQGENEVLAGEHSSNLAMAQLIDNSWARLQVQQVLRLGIEASIPVPRLLGCVDAGSHSVEALAD